MTIAVIDYGMGNLRSVLQALYKVAPEARTRVTSDPAEVDAAKRVVFPGQGAMPDCMAELERRHLKPAVLRAADEKPFLGICIGLQMLFEESEEGNAPGLGIFAGRTRRFPAPLLGARQEKLKVPHMGWNQVWRQGRHPLWAGIEDGARFYFVHSYCVFPDDMTLETGRCEYGLPFTCAVGRANIFAVQFHPEKSARDGLRLLKNFVSWQP
ncbi:MAG: imidazole glycerol phosphate synthase subunit HisH [Zoogloeaceae bacterium]|jgi:glutamine amidotransferase|nr:imidazole glycerol phosphate synthase subunit HisH [Zoogloeaceae bacterium]